MPLCCQVGCGWTVLISGKETVTMADGELHDFVTGKCETCDSIQLINPTTFAVDRMKALVKAADIAEKAVANG